MLTISINIMFGEQEVIFKDLSAIIFLILWGRKQSLPAELTSFGCHRPMIQSISLRLTLGSNIREEEMKFGSPLPSSIGAERLGWSLAGDSESLYYKQKVQKYYNFFYHVVHKLIASNFTQTLLNLISIFTISMHFHLFPPGWIKGFL